MIMVVVVMMVAVMAMIWSQSVSCSLAYMKEKVQLFQWKMSINSASWHDKLNGIYLPKPAGQDSPFEKMDHVREQQEKLARLHFELDSMHEAQRWGVETKTILLGCDLCFSYNLSDNFLLSVMFPSYSNEAQIGSPRLNIPLIDLTVTSTKTKQTTHWPSCDQHWD